MKKSEIERERPKLSQSHGDLWSWLVDSSIKLKLSEMRDSFFFDLRLAAKHNFLPFRRQSAHYLRSHDQMHKSTHQRHIVRGLTRNYSLHTHFIFILSFRRRAMRRKSVKCREAQKSQWLNDILLLVYYRVEGKHGAHQSSWSLMLSIRPMPGFLTRYYNFSIHTLLK